MRSLHPALQARLAALQQYKIKHASLEKMNDLLMNAIDEHTSYSILALYGPSGVGKSTVMKRIAQRCREEESDPSVVPVVVVQASPEDVGSAARLDFYRQVQKPAPGACCGTGSHLESASCSRTGKKEHRPGRMARNA
jgi:chromosomal replication initiation ATPase DnaA